MKLWIGVALVWLGFSGLVFVSLVLALGFGVLEALVATAVLLGLCWVLWSREIPAKDLQMRESTWNTPDDDGATRP